MYFKKGCFYELKIDNHEKIGVKLHLILEVLDINIENDKTSLETSYFFRDLYSFNSEPLIEWTLYHRNLKPEYGKVLIKQLTQKEASVYII